MAGRDTPFGGAVDLGAMAKERNAVNRATIGLADLAATVLRRHLPKDPAIRVSTEWDKAELPESHFKYAVLDVYATWYIFQTLSTSMVGQPVDSTTSGGTPVSLFSSDLTLVVAHGHIAPDRPSKYVGVNLTKTRALITITEIVVPGHLVSGELLPSSEDTPLSSLHKEPFNMVCKLRHLRTRVAQPPRSTEQAKPTPVVHPIIHFTQSDETETSETSDSTAPTTSGSWFEDMDRHDASEQEVSESIMDPAGIEKAQAIRNKGDGPAPLPSRVLGDIWHVMHQLPISSAHGLRRPFARALRAAFFDYSIEDKTAVVDFLAKKNVTFENMLREHPAWLLQRVRRFVPPPQELYERVYQVFSTYGPLKDAKRGSLTLFNDQIWDIAKSILDNIRCGFYSDPPGIPLYYTCGRDKHGLMRYRCVRGTNGIEGGVHQNIRRWFGVFNAGPAFAVELLRDYALHHNLRVGDHHDSILISNTLIIFFVGDRLEH